MFFVDVCVLLYGFALSLGLLFACCFSCVFVRACARALHCRSFLLNCKWLFMNNHDGKTIELQRAQATRTATIQAPAALQVWGMTRIRRTGSTNSATEMATAS